MTSNQFIRFFLTFSSLVMMGFGILTLLGALGLSPVLGWLFVLVALVDLVIAFHVFGK